MDILGRSEMLGVLIKSILKSIIIIHDNIGTAVIDSTVFRLDNQNTI